MKKLFSLVAVVLMLISFNSYGNITNDLSNTNDLRINSVIEKSNIELTKPLIVEISVKYSKSQELYIVTATPECKMVASIAGVLLNTINDSVDSVSLSEDQISAIVEALEAICEVIIAF